MTRWGVTVLSAKINNNIATQPVYAKMLNPWFVTGFCDSAATFTYSKAGKTLNLYFSLRQNEANRDIVEKIHSFFDRAGSIYISKNSQKKKQSVSYYYRVSRVEELKRIIEHFNEYPLQSKKHNGYLIWRKMVLHKAENFRDVDY